MLAVDFDSLEKGGEKKGKINNNNNSNSSFSSAESDSSD